MNIEFNYINGTEMFDVVVERDNAMIEDSYSTKSQRLEAVEMFSNAFTEVCEIEKANDYVYSDFTSKELEDYYFKLEDDSLNYNGEVYIKHLSNLVKVVYLGGRQFELIHLNSKTKLIENTLTLNISHLVQLQVFESLLIV